MIDLVFRCFSRARWITLATSRNIVDADGTPNKGFDVDEIGNLVLTPPILDASGNITTPAVLDTWYWVNLRIRDDKETADADTLFPGEVEDGFRFTKSKLVRFVREQATLKTLTYKGQSIRVYEFGTLTNRVQLVDPRDYGTLRGREWLGGMSF